MIQKNTLDHKSLGELFDPSSPFEVSPQQGWKAARIEGVGGMGVKRYSPFSKTYRAFTMKAALMRLPKSYHSLEEYAPQTSLFAENFSQAVTQSSIASVRISSFMSEYWKKHKLIWRRWKAFTLNLIITGAPCITLPKLNFNLRELGDNYEAVCNHILQFPGLHRLLDSLP